ncbi:MAG: hypothetical protein ACKPKF_25000 [Microcystis panniformis]
MLKKTSQFSGKSETQHLNLSESFCWVSLGVLLGFLGSTQSTIIAMITIIRSRGVLYAKLKQTEKAKINLQQAAIIFYQQNNMATYEKVMQLLRKLGG